MDATDGAVIVTRGLRKKYGYHLALAGVDLEVRRGETLAILGRNGAGKSTLLKLLAGLATPTGGEVRLFGEDPRRPAVRRRLGVVTHQTFLIGDLTVEENLRTWCRLQGLGPAESAVRSWLERVGLDDARRQRTGSLSRGQAQRLTLARALIPEPSVLLLDEPATGLDFEGATLLEELLREGDRTTVFVTHDVEAGPRLADRVLLLKDGRNVHDADAAEVRPGDIAARL